MGALDAGERGARREGWDQKEGALQSADVCRVEPVAGAAMRLAGTFATTLARPPCRLPVSPTGHSACVDMTWSERRAASGHGRLSLRVAEPRMDGHGHHIASHRISSAQVHVNRLTDGTGLAQAAAGARQ